MRIAKRLANSVFCIGFASLFAGGASGAVIDFEDYTLGNLVGQPAAASDKWANSFGDDSNTDVVAYEGGQVVSVATPPTGGSRVVYTPGNWGFAFDSNSSVLTLSFDAARPSDSNKNKETSLNLVSGSNEGNELLAFDFFSDGDGLAVKTNDDASGVASTNAVVITAVTNLLPTTGYVSISATLDFSTDKLTSVIVDGDEKLSSVVDLNFAGEVSSLGITLQRGSGDGTANAVFFDNIGINAVPEPASLALVGLGGLCLLSRSRR